MKHTFASAAILAILAAHPASASILLSSFGVTAAPSGSFAYSSGTSTVTGTNSLGSLAGPTANNDITGFESLEVIALFNTSATGGENFEVTLFDGSGSDTVTASFGWDSFIGAGPQTVVVPLSSNVSFDPADVVGWNLGATGGPVNTTPIDLTLTSMLAVTAIPEPGTLIPFSVLCALLAFASRRRS